MLTSHDRWRVSLKQQQQKTNACMHDNNVSHSAACFVRDNAANEMRTFILSTCGTNISIVNTMYLYNMWSCMWSTENILLMKKIIIAIYISKDTCDGSCQYTIYSVQRIYICMVIYHCKVQSTIQFLVRFCMNDRVYGSLAGMIC